MSGHINGMVTVNGGTIVPFENSYVEILGPGYSTHPNLMVVAYATEGKVKVSVVLFNDLCYVYRFRSYDSLQHYWSKMYCVDALINNKKYGDTVNYLLRARKSLLGY